jgi:FkbM family methyltransferase
MALQTNQEETIAARGANPSIDVEVLWDNMWIRRIGEHFLPDPEFLSTEDRSWPKWLKRVEKYKRDADDYWFHVYKPAAGDVIVDVGAGRGEDVYAFSQAVGPSGKVLAVEPHPVSFAALSKFCALNKLNNVDCVNFACVEQPALLQIETLPVWESNYVREGDASSTSYAVEGLQLDELVARHGINKIDFIKMNIEGAERMALPGAVQTFQSSSYTCVAAHDFRAERGEGDQFRTLSYVKDFLAQAGFSLTLREDDSRYYVKYHVHGSR